MDNTEITREILESLIRSHEPDDIILGLCEKYGLAWQDAEALVLRVQDENRDDITLRQAPLLTALALLTFIAGFVVLAIGIYPIVVVGIALVQRGDIKSILDSQEFYLAVNAMAHTGLTPFTATPLGIALVLGSLIGMRDVWAALLPRLKIGHRG